MIDPVTIALAVAAGANALGLLWLALDEVDREYE
jgi:hypothetical protein